ncbi:MAG: hypothetical protein JO024_01430 [Candidatus Eremiobacteraeota bacterium]|nr:hypothetical protein [Candidatus Eremiobacteraeota bacterium]
MKDTLDQTLLKIDALLQEATMLVTAARSGQPISTDGRYAKVRKEHPNTGKPWSTEADDELRKLFESGNTVEDLAIYFQRTQNGVRARLVKLGLLDEGQFQPRFVA